MKHAFLITAYKDIEQLNRLIPCLQSPFSFIFIHVDKKSSLSLNTLINNFKSDTNVVFVKKPIRVYWGGFSHLRSFLLLMKEAAACCDADYFHAISGQDFPIVPVEGFEQIITSHPKKEFISCSTFEALNWTGGSASRLQLYHLNDWFNIRVRFWKRINSRFLQLQRAIGIKRKLPADFANWYGGGTWWSLSKSAIRYILELVKNKPAILSSFKHTHCAEEIFFQTVLMNSPLAASVSGNDLRYVDWNFRNGSVPAILNEQDFEKVIASGKLFARKTESGISDKLIKRLQAHHADLSSTERTRAVSEKE